MIATTQQMTELHDFFKTGTRLAYRKRDYIIHPGEKPSHVFFIESGHVKAYDISKYGEENLLIIRKPHEIFPLIWSLTGQERHVIYEAITPATLWRIDRQTLMDHLNTHPDNLRPLLDMVTEMYRVHSERIISLEYRGVRERLVAFLLTSAERFGKPAKDGSMQITAPLRHQDIASSINASRETTSRAISALESKKLISSSRSLFTLHDVQKLRSML